MRFGQAINGVSYRWKILSALLIMPLATIVLFGASPARAAGTMTLNPSSGTVNVGDNLQVTLEVDTGGDGTNAVSAVINYPSGLFDTVTIDSSTSDYSITAVETASGGVINIQRGNVTDVTGVATVAVITLHASAAGNADLSFDGSQTHLVRTSDTHDILSDVGGGATDGAYVIAAVSNPGNQSGGNNTSGGTSSGSSSNGGTLAQTGDPITIASILSLLMLVGAGSGLALMRRHRSA